MSLSKEDKDRLRDLVNKAFSPAAPIDEKDLFAGRNEQVTSVVDAICGKGQHAIIFGERGVGKTSLANILSDCLQGTTKPVLAPHVNCDETDTFTSLWKKAFSEISICRANHTIGFKSKPSTKISNITSDLPNKITPHDVQKTLIELSAQAVPVIIFDELDRLKNISARRLFADTVKTLSDHSVPASLILVGVADTVDELVAEHLSIERALVQIRMPRMSREEIHEIIRKGLSKAAMTIEESALKRISLLSQGLPHYTHLLGLYSAQHALDKGETEIAYVHVEAAIGKAMDKAQQSIKSTYHKAVSSPRSASLYSQVLLACALSKTDELGYFAPVDVRTPIRYITKKSYEIPNFARHLNDFCETTRGPVLQKTGSSRRYRFRFINPLMQPFVIMKGSADTKVPLSLLEALVSFAVKGPNN